MSQSPSNPIIIIPAYEPTYSLITLIQEITSRQPGQIFIVVNDGSSQASQSIFQQVELHPNVILLQHAVNLGKGQALKTAFNYFLLHYPSSIGVVTADADGQHSPSDIERILSYLQNHHFLNSKIN